jgi:hypothetical protein
MEYQRREKSGKKASKLTYGSALKFCLWTAPRFVWASPVANLKIKGYKVKHIFVAAAVTYEMFNFAGFVIRMADGSPSDNPIKLAYSGPSVGSPTPPSKVRVGQERLQGRSFVPA